MGEVWLEGLFLRLGLFLFFEGWCVRVCVIIFCFKFVFGVFCVSVLFSFGSNERRELVVG